MGIFDDITSKGVNTETGLFNASSLGQLSIQLANQGINRTTTTIDRLAFNQGINVAQLGNVVGAVINSHILNKLAPHSAFAKQWLVRNPLTAHLTAEEVKRLILLSYAIEHARKNLWILNITPYTGKAFDSLTDTFNRAVSQNLVGNTATSQNVIKTAINSISAVNGLNNGGGMLESFNLLATELNYTPFALEGDQYNIGSAIIDGVKSSQQAEVSITTTDDEQGTIKRFFKRLASAVIHQDGTTGVLIDGLVKIRILHAFVNDEVNNNGFEETLICHPVGIEYDLSRREDALAEFTLRFVQTDTFIK